MKGKKINLSKGMVVKFNNIIIPDLGHFGNSEVINLRRWKNGAKRHSDKIDEVNLLKNRLYTATEDNTCV